MAPSVPTHLLLLLCIYAVSALRFASGSSLSPPQPPLFITALQSQCPLSVVPSAPVEVEPLSDRVCLKALMFERILPPIRLRANTSSSSSKPCPNYVGVDGESLDRILSSNQKNSYTSVFFYASWCPFSRSTKATFDVLSSMFPQITHLMLEESSVMPVVFSRYGVHSLPSILMVNRTTRLRYSGSKDLSSLVHFYKRITGFEPVQYFALDHPISLAYEKSPLVWNTSPKEILRREPYLVFSLLFLYLKLFLYFFPGILSRVLAFWVSYGWHLNLGIVGETSQLLERVLHVVNLKKVWSKLRLCKVRNFHNGAKNARVWASSLASVSLGESSSTRSA